MVWVFAVAALRRGGWRCRYCRLSRWCTFGFVVGSPQGRTGVSTPRSKLKQLSAPLLQAPLLSVEVAGPSLGFQPGFGENPPSTPFGYHHD